MVASVSRRKIAYRGAWLSYHSGGKKQAKASGLAFSLSRAARLPLTQNQRQLNLLYCTQVRNISAVNDSAFTLFGAHEGKTVETR